MNDSPSPTVEVELLPEAILHLVQHYQPEAIILHREDARALGIDVDKLWPLGRVARRANRRRFRWWGLYLQWYDRNRSRDSRHAKVRRPWFAASMRRQFAEDAARYRPSY